MDKLHECVTFYLSGSYSKFVRPGLNNLREKTNDTVLAKNEKRKEKKLKNPPIGLC